LEAHARALIQTHYADYGPTLACEKLRERHGVSLSKETVRRIMIDAGFWVPRKQRPPKIHQPRNRRACLGELVQIDGSEHAWFEDRAPVCTLLVFVDDATSRLMQLLFVPTESTFAYFAATRAYLEHHGKPVAFYSDKSSVFRINARGATAGRDYTQFGRALYELNIESICANTSQAKGRVERMNGTLQDRLVKELRLRNIGTLEAANAYAPVFMADFNMRFAKIPRSDFNAHRLIAQRARERTPDPVRASGPPAIRRLALARPRLPSPLAGGRAQPTKHPFLHARRRQRLCCRAALRSLRPRRGHRHALCPIAQRCARL